MFEPDAILTLILLLGLLASALLGNVVTRRKRNKGASKLIAYGSGCLIFLLGTYPVSHTIFGGILSKEDVFDPRIWFNPIAWAFSGLYWILTIPMWIGTYLIFSLAISAISTLIRATRIEPTIGAKQNKARRDKDSV
ncbi:MAG: hypothetical protein WBH04_04165 [Albidovulum sp.]